MSMEHKAFVFDYERFATDLCPLLEKSLRRGAIDELRAFIERHHDKLVDPYEGQPLGGDWEGSIPSPDPHQYGDFALTLYYDPRADIGLGCAWEAAQKAIARHGGPVVAVLGSPVGPSSEPFDPGKMGAYFQSSGGVRKRLAELRALLRNGIYDDNCRKVIEMLEAAERARKGLYLTF